VVRYSGLDITVHQSDQRRAPGHLSRQGPPALRWALYEAAQSAPRKSSPDREYYPCASSARRHSYPHELVRARQALTHADAPRPAPGIVLPPPPGGRPPKTERPQCLPQRDHPINHHVADPSHESVADRDKAGRPRAQHPHHLPRARTPDSTASNSITSDPALDTGPCTDKDEKEVTRPTGPDTHPAWHAAPSRVGISRPRGYRAPKRGVGAIRK
jgi:hypothetical protein